MFSLTEPVRAGLPEREVDRDVVGPVPGQPVDLVDDHVLDGVLGDEPSMPLQLGPVGGLGGLAAVDELLDDNRARAVGLAPAGLALRRDRVALGLAAPLGLLLGRNAQVDDRAASLHSVLHCYSYVTSFHPDRIGAS